MRPKLKFTPEKDGFYGAWYPASFGSGRAMIIMLGDSSDDLMARTGAKWLNKMGISALAMSPDKKDYGHHSYPLERFGCAIEFLQSKGYDKIGVVGASTTGMMALLAASYYPEISLTMAISPPDFVMEGFYQDGKDGMRERPGDDESSVTWKGEPLPYLPYAYRHPEYWQRIKADSKASGDFIASRPMFDESERRHPVLEEEKIKVERIKGKLIFIGAEDDVLWDTCKYIRRMEERLERTPHECEYESWLYEYGTHFMFPESLIKMVLPVGFSTLVKFMFRSAKDHPRECREARRDLDLRMKKIITEW